MSTTYNNIAGQSLERLSALSDGIFAVAMTLLVLDLHIPASKVIHSEQPLWMSGAIQSEGGLWSALTKLAPSLITYFMSFLTLGIFWVGHQTQLGHLARGNRNFTWINLGFLLVVSVMPFSTALLAAFSTYRIALVAYWLNIFLLGAVAFSGWRYAWRAGLVTDDTTADMRSAVERRIVGAQALYALGALLCVVNTYVSIAVIVLVQLNYVIAPRIRLLYRL